MHANANADTGDDVFPFHPDLLNLVVVFCFDGDCCAKIMCQLKRTGCRDDMVNAEPPFDGR